MDVGELSWIPVLHGPQGLALHHQRKEVLGPLLRLAYLHCSPFVDGRLLCPEEFPNVRLPVESGADLDSTGLMDREGGSSVSNVLTLATDGELQDLRVSPVVVAFGIEFKGDSPLLGEGGQGCQKGVPLQKLLSRKGE